MSSITNRDYRVVTHSRILSVQAKLVFWLLRDHQNSETGQCNPKIETLAREAAVSRRTIERALAELRKTTIIQAQRSRGFNRYVIADATRWPELLGDSRCDKAVVSEVPQMRQIDASRCDKLADLPPPVSIFSERKLLNGDGDAAAAHKTSPRVREAEPEKPAAAAAAPREEIKPSELCRELLRVHPHPQQPQKAEEELRKILPSTTEGDIRDRHAAWRTYWEANPAKFVPHLWRWFADGDWETLPPIRKPVASVTLNSRSARLEDFLQRRREGRA